METYTPEVEPTRSLTRPARPTPSGRWSRSACPCSPAKGPCIRGETFFVPESAIARWVREADRIL